MPFEGVCSSKQITRHIRLLCRMTKWGERLLSDHSVSVSEWREFLARKCRVFHGMCASVRSVLPDEMQSSGKESRMLEDGVEVSLCTTL